MAALALTPCSHIRTVLYVEDDDASAYLFQRALEEVAVDLNLIRVSDGEQALNFLCRQDAAAPPVHLIILDLNIPRRNGLEVLVSARKLKTPDELPIVIFSSSTLASDYHRSMALGANRFYQKTGDWKGLVGAVRSICEMLPAVA